MEATEANFFTGIKFDSQIFSSAAQICRTLFKIMNPPGILRNILQKPCSSNRLASAVKYNLHCVVFHYCNVSKIAWHCKVYWNAYQKLKRHLQIKLASTLSFEDHAALNTWLGKEGSIVLDLTRNIFLSLYFLLLPKYLTCGNCCRPIYILFLYEEMSN